MIKYYNHNFQIYYDNNTNLPKVDNSFLRENL